MRIVIDISDDSSAEVSIDGRVLNLTDTKLSVKTSFEREEIVDGWVVLKGREEKTLTIKGFCLPV